MDGVPPVSPRQDRLLRLMGWSVVTGIVAWLSAVVLLITGADVWTVMVAAAVALLSVVVLFVIGSKLRKTPAFSALTGQRRREWRDLRASRGGAWPATLTFLGRRVRRPRKGRGDRERRDP
jgi:hypothetical protein